MTPTTPHLKRAELFEWLGTHGFRVAQARAWIKAGVLPFKIYPGCKQRYYLTAEVATALDIRNPLERKP